MNGGDGAGYRRSSGEQAVPALFGPAPARAYTHTVSLTRTSVTLGGGRPSVSLRRKAPPLRAAAAPPPPRRRHRFSTVLVVTKGGEELQRQEVVRGGGVPVRLRDPAVAGRRSGGDCFER